MQLLAQCSEILSGSGQFKFFVKPDQPQGADKSLRFSTLECSSGTAVSSARTPDGIRLKIVVFEQSGKIKRLFIILNRLAVISHTGITIARLADTLKFHRRQFGFFCKFEIPLQGIFNQMTVKITAGVERERTIRDPA